MSPNSPSWSAHRIEDLVSVNKVFSFWLWHILSWFNFAKPFSCVASRINISLLTPQMLSHAPHKQKSAIWHPLLSCLQFDQELHFIWIHWKQTSESASQLITRNEVYTWWLTVNKVGVLPVQVSDWVSTYLFQQHSQHSLQRSSVILIYLYVNRWHRIPFNCLQKR